MRCGCRSGVSLRDVLLEGFTIAEAGPFWTIHLVYCENVIARGLTVLTKQKPEEPLPPNTDGLNLDSSRNVLVEYCVFDVGDDAVCLKSGINEDGRRVGRPTENVVVRQVTTHWCLGGVVIGSEMSGGVRNVSIKAGKGMEFNWVNGLSLTDVACAPATGRPLFI